MGKPVSVRQFVSDHWPGTVQQIGFGDGRISMVETVGNGVPIFQVCVVNLQELWLALLIA